MKVVARLVRAGSGLSTLFEGEGTSPLRLTTETFRAVIHEPLAHP